MSNLIIKVFSVYTCFLPPDENHPPTYINLGNVTSVEFNEIETSVSIQYVNGECEEFTGFRAVTLWEIMGKTNQVNPEVEGEME